MYSSERTGNHKEIGVNHRKTTRNTQDAILIGNHKETFGKSHGNQQETLEDQNNTHLDYGTFIARPWKSQNLITEFPFYIKKGSPRFWEAPIYAHRTYAEFITRVRTLTRHPSFQEPLSFRMFFLQAPVGIPGSFSPVIVAPKNAPTIRPCRSFREGAPKRF